MARGYRPVVSSGNYVPQKYSHHNFLTQLIKIEQNLDSSSLGGFTFFQTINNHQGQKKYIAELKEVIQDILDAPGSAMLPIKEKILEGLTLKTGFFSELKDELNWQLSLFNKRPKHQEFMLGAFNSRPQTT